MTIQTYREQISQGREQAKVVEQQATQAEEQLQKVKSSLPDVTSQKARRQTYAGMQGRIQRKNVERAEQQVVGKQEEVKQYKERVKEFKQGLTQSEQELETYLQTPQGQLTYVKEYNLQPVDYERRSLGRGEGFVNLPIYETPTGRVVDETDLYETYDKITKQQAQELGMSVKELREAGAWTKALGGAGGTFVVPQMNIPQGVPETISLEPVNTAVTDVLSDSSRQDRATSIETKRGFSWFTGLATGIPSVSASEVTIPEDQRKSVDVNKLFKGKETFFTKFEQPISSNKDLNIPDTSKINDINVSTRTNLLGFGVSLTGNTIRNLVGNFGDFNKAKEVYDPRTNRFVSGTPGVQAYGSSTLISRELTPEEQAKIDKPKIQEQKFFEKVRAVESTFIPAITLDQPVYLPDKKSLEEYSKLLESSKYGIFGGTGGYKLSEFVSKQAEQLKLDTKRAEIAERVYKETGSYPKEFNYKGKVDVDKLYSGFEIAALSGTNKDYVPSGWDILKGGAETYTQEGKTINLLGEQVSPDFARGALKFGVEAYKLEKPVLLWQIGGATLGRFGFVPAVTGSTKALKVLKITSGISTAVLGTSIGATEGIREYIRSGGDISYSLGAGLGSATGFFGSIYSKELFGVGEKLFRPIKGKKGSLVGMEPLEESKYTEEYDQVTGERRFVEKSKVTRLQAIEKFKTLTRTEQTKILTQSFLTKEGKPKIYLDAKSLSKDVNVAKQFLKEAELNKAQIADRLRAVKLRMEYANLLRSYQAGEISQPEYLSKIQSLKNAEQKLIRVLQKNILISEPILTPKIKSVGGLILEPKKVISKGIVILDLEAPKMVGGQGKVESIFAGQGQYERTNFMTGMAIKQEFKPVQVLKSELVSEQQLKLRPLQVSSSKEESVVLSKTSQVVQQKSEQKLETKQVALLKSKFRQDQIFKQLSKTKQLEVPKSAFVSLSINKQESITKRKRIFTPEKQKPQNKIPTKEPVRPIKPFDLDLAISKVKTFAKEQPEEFEIFVTKLGKDISIGKKGTQKEAEELLLGRIRSRLTASGFLTKGGVKLKATQLKSFGGGEFRFSKVSPYKIVERKEKRLRKITTGKEIQMFRPTRKSKRGIF